MPEVKTACPLPVEWSVHPTQWTHYFIIGSPTSSFTITQGQLCRLIWGAPRVRRFFGKPKKPNVFWKPKYSMLLLEKNRKKMKNRGKTGKNEEKSVFYWNRTILIRVLCNWITFWHLHTKNWREFVWNLITSSKYLTFNILREYWVACCVFFYRSFDFRTYFLKNPVHSVFSGRFSFFCRNRLTLGAPCTPFPL
jgi:hypothetical protein